jgi:hypothetical protein
MEAALKKEISATARTLKYMLASANAVSVDGSPKLEKWLTAENSVMRENFVLEFRWSDNDYDYHEAFTAEDIDNGSFCANGAFICENAPGQPPVKIEFFKITPLQLPAVYQTWQEAHGQGATLMGSDLFYP